MKAAHFILSSLLTLGLQAFAQTSLDRVEELLAAAEYQLYVQNRTDSALYYALQTEAFKSDLAGDLEVLERIEEVLYKSFKRSNNDERELMHLERLSEIQAKKNSGISLEPTIVNYGRLGTFHLQKERYEESLHYFQKAKETAIAFGKRLRIAGAHNNLGVLHERMGKKEEARELYHQAIDSLGALNGFDDTTLFVSIRENLARLFAEQKQFEKAEEILAVNYRLLMSLPQRREGRETIAKNLLRTSLNLISLYDSLGQAPKMLPYLEEIPSFLIRSDFVQLTDGRIRFQNALIRYYQLVGEQQEALAAQEKLQVLVKTSFEELTRRNRVVNRAISDAKVQEVNKALEAKELRLEKTQLALENRRNLLVFVVLLALIGILIVYYYQKRKVALANLKRQLEKKELENQQLKNEQLQKDLKHKEADISNFVMQANMKESLSAEMIEKLNQLKEKDSISVADIKQVIRELKPQKDVSERLDIYQKGLEKVNHAFFEKLEQQYPSLTKTEREVCGLMRLNLSGKEIAQMRNIDPSSVRKMRNRVRKKFALSAEEDLYLFLQKL